MEKIYSTKRLYLYPMTTKFRVELDQLHADHDVMASVGGSYSSEASFEKVQESEAHWEKYGFGLWCWFDKLNNDFIGRGGLRWQQLDNGQNIVEIAYMVNKRFWGHGFATEVAQYCIDIGINYLNIKEIVVITTPTNIPSQRVMEKAGLTFDKKLVSFRGVPHLIARIHDDI